MAEPVVLIDTGPLVAFLNRRDRFHEWAVEQLGRTSSPLHTCEAVVSEVCFLLHRGGAGSEPMIELLRRGLVVPSFRLLDETRRVGDLMSRYRDHGISLADACLLRMTELSQESRVLTLDRGFRVFRRNGRQVVPVTMPDAA